MIESCAILSTQKEKKTHSSFAPTFKLPYFFSYRAPPALSNASPLNPASLQSLTTQTHTDTRAHKHTRPSLLRNMRAVSNSQAGKAALDSNLDLAGLGYFYFAKSQRGGRKRGGEEGRRQKQVCMFVSILVQMSEKDR